MTPADEMSLLAIERLTGQKIERVLLPNFGGALPLQQTSANKFTPTGRKTVRSFRSRRGR
jgi:hypothetical protein